MMKPLPPNPYKALGVSKDAQTPEIRSAYRKLVLTCHPDKVQDPEKKKEKQEEFQRVQQAYELLTNETERSKYDDQVQFLELQKEMAKNIPNTSVPRTPTQARHFEIRTEHRPSAYGSSPMSPPGISRIYKKSYVHRDDDYVFIDPKGVKSEGRKARKSSSYEKSKDDDRSSRKDDDREQRRKVREKERDRDEDVDRKREKRSTEKLPRRADSWQAEKRPEKERRSRSEDRKHRSRHEAYVESYDEDDRPKTSKKKSSSSWRYEEKRERSSPRDAVNVGSEEKLNTVYDYAASYIDRNRMPGMPRAATFTDKFSMRNSPPSAPTPPPTRDMPYVYDDADDVIRRSSARTAHRRASYDTPKSKERGPSHKKTHSGPKEASVEDVPFDGEHDLPYRSGPRRASTFNEREARPAAQPMPSLPRASTFSGERADSRGRSRSKLVGQVVSVSDDEEEEAKEEAYARRESRKHHSSRRKHSPDPVYAEPPSRHYTKERRAPARGSPYREPQLESIYGGYYPDIPGVRMVRPQEYGGGSSRSGWKVNQAPRFTDDDVAYGSYGRAPYRGEVYGY